MWITKWLPWKFFIKRAAKAYDFLDPIILMARLRRFGHPSEVNEPIELLRAGMIFHARGLINTRAIQYNLDWIWPYWIVKQFKPNDTSFIPRGFSFSHVNLTHRNWTAVGLPDLPCYPIVDPRGMVTPYFDGWSLEFWIRLNDGTLLVPSEMDAVQQHLRIDDHRLGVDTACEGQGWRLTTAVWVETESDDVRLQIQARAMAEPGSQLILSLRPYNPEGIQFIHAIEYDRDKCQFQVNGKDHLALDRPPWKTVFSDYANGDVAHHLDTAAHESAVTCNIGMATGAALFRADEDRTAQVRVCLPLVDDGAYPHNAMVSPHVRASHVTWQTRLSEAARLDVPDEQVQFLYDAAVRTLILLTAEEPYPGPYTYKRFWFRDACFMIHALLAVGLTARAERMVAEFPKRQTLTGYFQSQEGEWDANGQALWILDLLHDRAGMTDEPDLIQSVYKGAQWIITKRRRKDDGAPHDGLFPAGFSAEHLGPNDYYYWDNFWGVAGLRAAARLAGIYGDDKRKTYYRRQADEFWEAIMASLRRIHLQRSRIVIPASPYRRLDAGAIGSLVADYPLRLLPPADPMVMNTIAYLRDHCFHSGAFFQDMIHSGINVYLTLAIAQGLLRANDSGYRQLILTVADLASPTGQWPEAIHPFTKGGCMGDGQHGWAAAEWLMMIRNLFVREEGDAILIGSGLFTEWLDSGRELAFGPTAIPGGQLSVALKKRQSAVRLKIGVDGSFPSRRVVAAIPGYPQQVITDMSQPLIIEPG